jgi:hypothetical protein
MGALDHRGKIERPIKRLGGFTQVFLKSGEHKTVQMD